MAKIDEIKEILNTLRITMSIVAGILVVLVGKLFTKFEKQEFGTIFWVVFFVIMIFVFIEAIVVLKISNKTKEIKDL